ncbi:MAG: hypothetical protein ACOCP8_05920 [archaeon]
MVKNKYIEVVKRTKISKEELEEYTTIVDKNSFEIIANYLRSKNISSDVISELKKLIVSELNIKDLFNENRVMISDKGVEYANKILNMDLSKRLLNLLLSNIDLDNYDPSTEEYSVPVPKKHIEISFSTYKTYKNIFYREDEKYYIKENLLSILAKIKYDLLNAQ